jgi:chemotaxis protein CheZ
MGNMSGNDNMPQKKQEELNKVINRLTLEVAEGVSGIVTETVEQELLKTLPKALKEGEFFKKVNEDMRNSLEEIYHEIVDVKKGMKSSPTADNRETDMLLTEATDHLDEIMKSTEEATVSIMDIVEKHQEMIIKSGELLSTFRTGGASKQAVDELIDLNDVHQKDLTEIMTTLSFQDLTGQRIKRIITALSRIEEIVFHVYMTTGVMEKVRKEHPDQDFKELHEAGHQRVSALKGPQNGTSQNDVDDLLSKLGLE